VVDTAGRLVHSTLRTTQEYVTLIEKNAAQITGMGIVYAPNNITVVEGAFGEFIPGGRFPDISFVKSHSIHLRLYELVKYGIFLAFTNGVSFDTPGWVANRIEIWKCESTPEGYSVTTAAGAKLTTDFVFPEEAVVIMRPDLYVGYVGKNPKSYFRGS
jgi:phenol 2-monooxygenase